MVFSFDGVFISIYSPKAVKGQALAGVLADHPCLEIGDESALGLNSHAASFTHWTLLFDGSRTEQVLGCGIIIISPTGLKTQLYFQIDFECSNNQAEYEAIVIDPEILQEIEVTNVQIVDDSQLVIKHLAGEHKCHREDLAPYYMAAKQLIDDFDDVLISHILRRYNNEANELAQTATRVNIPQGVYQRTITVQKRVLPSVRRRNLAVEKFSAEISEKDWRTPIIKFLKRPYMM